MILEYAQDSILSTVLKFVDIRRYSPWPPRIQERTEHRQASAHSSRRHQRIPQKWDGADSMAMPWGDRRADYMECVDRTCIVLKGNFWVSHQSKELQMFDWCRISPGLRLSGRWIGLGIYMQMAVALSYVRVCLDGIMSNTKAESMSYYDTHLGPEDAQRHGYD